MGNSRPADEGRAGMVSPTHPHNKPGLDGHETGKQKMCEDTPIKTKNMHMEEVVQLVEDGTRK